MNNFGLNPNSIDFKRNQLAFRNSSELQMPSGNNFDDNLALENLPENVSNTVELPDIYYNPNPGKEQKTLVDKIKQFDMFGAIYPWLETPLLMGGTCLALSKALDKYTDACGGEYEKSLLGKVTKFGDNIENSNFVKSDSVQSVLGWIKKGATKTNEFLKRSSLLNAIRFTPARPEKQMPKSELISQEVRIMEDFNKIVETLRLNPAEEKGSMFGGAKSGSLSLSNLGLNKAEKKFLEETFGKDYKKLSQEKLSNSVLLKRLGWTTEKIKSTVDTTDATSKVKQALLDTLGLTVDDLSKIKVKPEEYVSKVKDAVTKAGKKIKIGTGNISWLGPIQPLERTISCDQVANKLRSIMDTNISKTGKFFAKVIHKIHRGFTFGGGKGGMCIFIAPSLVLMLKNLKKADKDQKVGTVANGFIEAISWVFTFPLSIAATYAIGGMRFAGMSKDNVKKFMADTDAFNKLVDEGKLMDKGKYDKALENLMQTRKKLRTVGKQNLFARMVRNITNFFYCDLNTVRSFKDKNVLMNKVRQIPNFIKHLGLEPLRFILCAFAIESVLRGLVEKSSKAIFGNHYDHFKEEEYANKKKEQKKFTKEDLQQRLYEVQAKKINPQLEENQNLQAFVPSVEALKNVATETEKVQENSKQVVDLNLPDDKTSETIDLVAEKPSEEAIKVSKAKYIPEQISKIATSQNEKVDNYTYIPSSENVIANLKKAEENINKYIPSQIGAKFTRTFDNSALESALKRADRAEQKAIQVLAGKFNGF